MSPRPLTCDSRTRILFRDNYSVVLCARCGRENRGFEGERELRKLFLPLLLTVDSQRTQARASRLSKLSRKWRLSVYDTGIESKRGSRYI